ncbi:hypothetical protein GTQ34_16045 [Muricauda sp. JGD-17]|uniref:Peptidase S74 domain-containing protein n=1 Tax=Flagellimonas ochracea TaxID=2696472 RepID=A0A964TFM5_9FLAO|nr:hypothetical protein [Allomuricauda ochracea]NAY93423.1 hypothetical protein [Allomuricauda ochracea]
MRKKIFVVALYFLCTAPIIYGQWSPPAAETNFITTTHSNALQDFGFDLESSGGNYRYLIENNINGANQQALYFGHSNGSKNIFGISSSSDSGTTWNPRFTINQNGYVGFNTNSPITDFHVNGRVTLNPGLTNDNYVNFLSNTSTQINMVFYSQNDAKWNFYTSSDGKFYFRKTDNNPGGGVKMTLDGGNVGIGTTSPQEKLQVHGSALIASDKGASGITDVSNYGSASGLFFGNAGSILDNDNNTLNIVSRANMEFVVDELSGSSTKAMYIKTNGHVGIGTSNPDSELAVNGIIHSKEVKVDLVGWPDYVFDNDHILPTLEEVEKHIKEKGHLMNIPSAKEVEENGIQLGEMNKLLLEKIEELTLHLLAQEKRLKKIEQLLRID